MIKLICRALWWASETSGVGLGRFAPLVFGGCVGRMPRRRDGS